MLTSPSFTCVPQLYLSFLVLERLQALVTATLSRGNTPHYHTHPITQKSHLCVLLRNESQAKLLKTDNMVVKINYALSICQETKFPNFYLQFSQNGFPISYTEFGHIFATPEAPLEILLNLKSQPHLQINCCCYLAKNIALKSCKYILNNCPLPHSNIRGCSQASKKQLIIQNKHCKEV